MKVKAFLALFFLVCTTSVLAESNCNARLIQENEQCRTTFKRCMANPVFSSLCAGQLENCSKVANERATTCNRKEQECMNRLMEKQDLCQAGYFQCMQNPAFYPVCASKMDNCSKQAENEAKRCVEAALSYL